MKNGRVVLGSRARRLVVVLSLGFALTLASTLVSASITADPGGDGYRGDARLVGFPVPYAFIVAANARGSTVEAQVSCEVAWPFCRYPAPSDRVGVVRFCADWLVWSVIASAALLVWAAALRRVRARAGPFAAA